MAAAKHYLMITALGLQKPETVHEFSRACAQCGCNLLNIKMNAHGAEMAMVLFLSGNWSAIAKIEAALPTLEEKLELKLLSKRSSNTALEQGPAMIYQIQVTALDKTGILQGLTSFLHQQHIHVEEISAHTYLTTNGSRMVSLNIKIHIAESIHLASLREQFLLYCDNHNLDAFLEPLRH